MVDAAARVPPQRPCGPGPGGGPSLAAPVEWWPQRGVELSAEKYLNWSGKILYRASRCEQWHSSSRDQQHAVPAGAPGARHPGQPGPGHQVAVSKFIHFFQIEFRYVRYMLDVPHLRMFGSHFIHLRLNHLSIWYIFYTSPPNTQHIFSYHFSTIYLWFGNVFWIRHQKPFTHVISVLKWLDIPNIAVASLHLQLQLSSFKQSQLFIISVLECRPFISFYTFSS